MSLTALRRCAVTACTAALGLALLAGGQPAAQAVQSAPSGPAARALDPVDRATIIRRAQEWVDKRVPYDGDQNHLYKWGSHRYLQDCSGYVSWAWGLPGSYGTAVLKERFSSAIGKDDLRPGDVLLQRTRDHGHVVIFAGWKDAATAIVYQESVPGSVASKNPLSYDYLHAQGFEPRRYVRVID